jgi:hypothetical protein
MARDYTPHQQRIIRNYYRNLDQIRAQRLQEIVGEIWLATSEKKKDRLWARAADLLGGADAAPAEVRLVLERRDVEALARLAGRD